MIPKTKELIKTMEIIEKNLGSNGMNEVKARLWGRADALDMVIRNFNFCCDFEDFNKGSYCNQCAVFLGFKDEIKIIRDALRGVEDGN